MVGEVAAEASLPADRAQRLPELVRGLVLPAQPALGLRLRRDVRPSGRGWCRRRHASMRAMACSLFQARAIRAIATGMRDIAIITAAGGMRSRGGLRARHITMVATADIGPTFALRSGDTTVMGITAACALTVAIDGKPVRSPLPLEVATACDQAQRMDWPRPPPGCACQSMIPDARARPCSRRAAPAASLLLLSLPECRRFAICH